MNYRRVTFSNLQDKPEQMKKEKKMVTKIAFTLTPDVLGSASAAMVLGDFNNWNPAEGIYMEVQEDGSMRAEMYLSAGQTYQYRYLLNDGRWVNDESAKTFAEVFGYPVENCVITIPEQKKKATTRKATPKKASEKMQVTFDDLTKIEGIGKKIMALLVAENILTFKDLSKCSIKKLKTILTNAGSKFSMHDPSSWPKQAKLAVAGKWDDLADLQKELAGGK